MARVLIFPADRFPPALNWQAVSFMRVAWPFIDGGVFDQTYPMELDPVHFALVEDDLLISYAATFRLPLDHQGTTYQMEMLATSSPFRAPARRSRPRPCRCPSPGNRGGQAGWTCGRDSHNAQSPLTRPAASQQQRQVRVQQVLGRGLGGVHGDIHRRADRTGAVADRRGDRADARGELLVGQRPTLGPDPDQLPPQFGHRTDWAPAAARNGSARRARRPPRPRTVRRAGPCPARSAAAGKRVPMSTRSAMILGTATRAT